MARYTEEELDAMGLTDEEMEGLLADDEPEPDDEGDDDDGGNDGGNADGNDGAGNGDDPGKAGDDDADGGKSDDEGGDADQDGGEANPPRQQAAPILAAEDPSDAEERLNSLAEEKQKLIERFDDGELTAKEYQQELDKLAKQEREIEQAQFKAQLAREMEETRAKNEWLATVNSFLDEHPRYRESKLLFQSLDMTVRELAGQEENQGLTGEQILAKAHEHVQSELGLQDKPAKQEPDNKRGRKIEAPPTLAKVPAADMSDMADGRWSKLDRLLETDPERYEAELGRLSDADREAYLAAQ